MNNTEPLHIDALIPPEMARRSTEVGAKKAGMDSVTTIVLGILAGAFIAFGALLSTIAVTDAAGHLSYGVTRLLAGGVFSLGLILVVVGGAELFTGNNLIVMAWASGKVSTRALLRNWGLVYLGNFVGSIELAWLVAMSGHLAMNNGAIRETALRIAVAKLQIPFVEAVILGILCNVLVCLAVWMSFSARSTTDRILAVIPPVTAFVAAGFEHSVANMYFIPVALFANGSSTQFPDLTWSNFLINNLLPVTIGNIIGGGGLVGVVYWFVYLRQTSANNPQTASSQQADSLPVASKS